MTSKSVDHYESTNVHGGDPKQTEDRPDGQNPPPPRTADEQFQAVAAAAANLLFDSSPADLARRRRCGAPVQQDPLACPGAFPGFLLWTAPREQSLNFVTRIGELASLRLPNRSENSHVNVCAKWLPNQNVSASAAVAGGGRTIAVQPPGQPIRAATLPAESYRFKD